MVSLTTLTCPTARRTSAPPPPSHPPAQLNKLIALGRSEASSTRSGCPHNVKNWLRYAGSETLSIRSTLLPANTHTTRPPTTWRAEQASNPPSYGAQHREPQYSIRISRALLQSRMMPLHADKRAICTDNQISYLSIGCYAKINNATKNRMLHTRFLIRRCP